MVALSYESLDSITGVNYDPANGIHPKMVASSMRSRDRNSTQRISFQGDASLPFSGILHVQATVQDPTNSNVWFDVVEMQVDDEGGTWSVEIDGEFASLRVVCKKDNYWAATKSNVGATIGTSGDFTINGITVNVAAGDNLTAVANKINATAGISAAGITADIFTTGALRIRTNNGAYLVLSDGTNNPLNAMGFVVPATVKAGRISAINMLR